MDVEILAHRILEKLDDAFPRKLHLHQLRAALLEYEGVPIQEWLLAVEALRAESKLGGKFLQDGTSLADAAALFITARGRLYLHGPSGRAEAARLPRLAIHEAQKIAGTFGRQPTMPTKPLSVFLCHSSGDKPQCEETGRKAPRDRNYSLAR